MLLLLFFPVENHTGRTNTRIRNPGPSSPTYALGLWRACWGWHARAVPHTKMSGDRRARRRKLIRSQLFVHSVSAHATHALPLPGNRYSRYHRKRVSKSYQTYYRTAQVPPKSDRTAPIADRADDQTGQILDRAPTTGILQPWDAPEATPCPVATRWPRPTVARPRCRCLTSKSRALSCRRRSAASTWTTWLRRFKVRDARPPPLTREFRKNARGKIMNRKDAQKKK